MPVDWREGVQGSFAWLIFLFNLHYQTTRNNKNVELYISKKKKKIASSLQLFSCLRDSATRRTPGCKCAFSITRTRPKIRIINSARAFELAIAFIEAVGWDRNVSCACAAWRAQVPGVVCSNPPHDCYIESHLPPCLPPSLPASQC